MSNLMAKLVPLESAHFDVLELREQEKITIGTKRERYEVLAQHGTCGIMVHDGRVLGVIGYCEMAKGTLEVFILPSVYVSMYSKVFARTVKNLLDSLQKSHAVRRFQTASLDDELHNRWMTYLGFENETPNGMRCYIGDMTYNIWAKVFD